MKKSLQTVLGLLTLFVNSYALAFPELVALNATNGQLDHSLANPATNSDFDRMLVNPATKQNGPVNAPGVPTPRSDQAWANRITTQLRTGGYDMSRTQVTVIGGHVILSGDGYTQDEASVLSQSAQIANGGVPVTNNVKIRP
jgi:hypothetical protein